MKKNRLLVFDIDGTICDINKPVNDELLYTIKEISKKNIIVLASGKPFGYIAGLIRQLGLDGCMAVGENGGTIMYSATFPPKEYYKIDVSESVENKFFHIKREFVNKFGNIIWFQPNDVNLTVFPINIKDIGLIHSFAKTFEDESINTYYHKDSVDFTPKGFDKGTAIDVLLEKFFIDIDDLYVFGDGSNDLPMLVKTSNSVVINNILNGFTPKYHLKNYDELNNFLKNTFI